MESCRASTLLAELTDDELPDPDDDENDDDDNDEDDEDYEEEEECYEVTVRLSIVLSRYHHYSIPSSRGVDQVHASSENPSCTFSPYAQYGI